MGKKMSEIDFKKPIEVVRTLTGDTMRAKFADFNDLYNWAAMHDPHIELLVTFAEKLRLFDV